MKSVDSLPRDAQLDLYQSLRKSGQLKDDQSLQDETVRQNEELIADAIKGLVIDLIEESKGCNKPFTIDSINNMINNWKETGGIIDNYPVIKFLKDKIADVIAMLPNTTGDALKKKYGFPNITYDNIDNKEPYNSSTIFDATGKKYHNGGKE